MKTSIFWILLCFATDLWWFLSLSLPKFLHRNVMHNNNNNNINTNNNNIIYIITISSTHTLRLQMQHVFLKNKEKPLIHKTHFQRQ